MEKYVFLLKKHFFRHYVEEEDNADEEGEACVKLKIGIDTREINETNTKFPTLSRAQKNTHESQIMVEKNENFTKRDHIMCNIVIIWN